MSFPYRKIMCPIDFDENSVRTLESALQIARHFGAAMIVVHVVPTVVELPEAADIPGVSQRYEEAEKTARQRLAEVVRQITDIVCESGLYAGNIVDGILQGIERFKPDLLVMATDGRAGLQHFFLGSVAEAVLRKASCPVLTIRTEAS